MTIDEAIAGFRYNAEILKSVEEERIAHDSEHDSCECEQIAEWLEELKIYKESNISIKNYKKGRADATNEIHTELITEIAMLNATKMTDEDLYTFAVRIKEITDKLKEGAE